MPKPRGRTVLNNGFGLALRPLNREFDIGLRTYEGFLRTLLASNTR